MIQLEDCAMTKKGKVEETVALKDGAAAELNRLNCFGASSSEAAEYVAEMTAELMTIAKSCADYIAAMTGELSTLARSAQLERLRLLLELVCREAKSAAI
jgi:hypothetical protein